MAKTKVAALEIYAPEVKIDKNCSIPFYLQLEEAMKKAIIEGAVASGTKIEDEVSMAKRLGVSRPTVRRALQSLVDLNLIMRRRAVGTVVSPREIHRPVRLTSLYEDLNNNGQKPTTKVVELATILASVKIARKLQIEEDSRVGKIIRIRYADNEPLALMTNYVPLEILPSFDELAMGGLYQGFRERGVTVVSAQQSISARKATQKESELLSEQPGAAVLAMERVAFDELGKAVEYGSHIYRADRYSFTVALHSS